MKAAFLYTIAFLVALSAHHAQAAAEMTSGKWIVAGCNYAAKSISDHDFTLALPPELLASEWSCVGAATATFQLEVLYKTACPPHGVTSGQNVRMIAKYLDDNPELLHLDYVALMAMAVQETWPCPPK